MATNYGKKKWKGKSDGKSMEEKVQDLLGVLEQGVKNFTYSPEDFKAILQMKALMPKYSFNNLIVAMTQLPTVSYIASFNRWNELGRKVKKGEKALKIFAPRIVKEEDEITGEVKHQLKDFITVPVFDIAQTEGEPLPIDRIKIILEGDSPEARRIIELAEKVAALDDCPVRYGDTGTANGYYHWGDHYIQVSNTLSINHRCKTLVHELVHSKVHRYSKATSKEKEVVAEGTAFVVCNYFGLDSSDYSFRYVKGWSQGDEEALVKFGSQISDLAGVIIQQFQQLEEQHVQVVNNLTA